MRDRQRRGGGTIEVAASEPSSAVVSEAVTPGPAVAKGEAEPKSKGIVAPPEVAVKRKPGRPRKATA